MSLKLCFDKLSAATKLKERHRLVGSNRTKGHKREVGTIQLGKAKVLMEFKLNFERDREILMVH